MPDMVIVFDCFLFTCLLSNINQIMLYNYALFVFNKINKNV